MLNLLSCLRKVIFLKTQILKRAFFGKAVFEVTVKFFAKTVKKCCFCQPVRVKSSGCKAWDELKAQTSSVWTLLGAYLDYLTQFWQVGSCIHGLILRGGSKGPCLGEVFFCHKKTVFFFNQQIVG